MSASGDEGRASSDQSGRQLRRPGHELGAARDRAGISLEDMASRLHLTTAQVEALERDDYQHLPAAAFVRGYLRAYAKQVGMDGDALVHEFDTSSDRTAAPELVLSRGVPDEPVGRGPFMAVATLILIALVGAGAWWVQQNSILSPPSFDQAMTGDSASAVPDGSAAGDAEVAGSDAEVEPRVAGEDGAGAASPEVETASAAAGDAGTAALDATGAGMETDTGDQADAVAQAGARVQSDAGVQAESGVQVDAGDQADAAEQAESGVQADAEDQADAEVQVDAGNQADSGIQANTEMSADVTIGSDTVAVDEGGQDTAVEQEDSVAQGEPEGPLATSDADQVATTAADTGPDRIEVVVDGRSWLEVYDSRGRRLAYTLYSGAAPVVLNGWAPFEVFLGNSPVVTVRVDGVAVDQSPFVRSDNTARFLADSEGARRR